MILDITFLVDLVRGDPGARAFLEAAEKGSEALHVPAPTLMRLWEGVERSRHAPRDLERLRAVLAAAPTVPLTPEDAERAGRMLGARAREGDAMDPFDAMVAAVALGLDQALVTRNVREFESVPGLRLVAY